MKANRKPPFRLGRDTKFTLIGISLGIFAAVTIGVMLWVLNLQDKIR